MNLPREVFGRDHDFEAKLLFLSPEEGGRKILPCPGYRSDLRYPDFPEDRTHYIVWPHEFFTEERDIAEGEQVPRDVIARFWVLNPDYRPFHRDRACAGRRIEVMEGAILVAHGVLTRIVSLAE